MWTQEGSQWWSTVLRYNEDTFCIVSSYIQQTVRQSLIRDQKDRGQPCSAPLHLYTPTLLQPDTPTILHFYTLQPHYSTPLHFCAPAPLHRYTPANLHPYAFTPLHPCTLAGLHPYTPTSCHNFKPQNFKLRLSNPNKYLSYVRCQFSNGPRVWF